MPTLSLTARARAMRLEGGVRTTTRTSAAGGGITAAGGPMGLGVRAPSAVAAVQETIQAAAEPLNASQRGELEPRFGFDFSRVRVHCDDAAAQSAHGIGALAYTVGDHVVFGAGQYAPTSARGQRILAHELTHVVQNSAATSLATIALGDPLDRFEREASEVTDKLTSGRGTKRPIGALSTLLKPGAVIQRLRPEEMVDPTNVAAGDKLARQTFKVSPGTIDYHLNGKSVSVPKELGVFVPSGVASANLVHVFFTPYVAAAKGIAQPLAALSYVAEQGLRSEAESSGWILIAVPAMEEGDALFVTVSTSDIQACLAAAGRPDTTNIKSIRLTAHSRGYRGLAHTMRWTSGGPAEIDLSKVDRVSVFDASYKDLGDTLRSHAKDLPKLQDKNDPSKLDKDAVRLYDVTVKNVSGLAGIDLRDPLAVHGIAYVRFAQDAIARGLLDISEFAPPSPSDQHPRPPADVRAATTRLLAKMPMRGGFTTQHPQNFLSWSPGVQDIQTFIRDNRNDLRLVAREKDGLKAFLIEIRVPSGGQPWANDAHHWLATELSHEATDFTDYAP